EVDHTGKAASQQQDKEHGRHPERVQGQYAVLGAGSAQQPDGTEDQRQKHAQLGEAEGHGKHQCGHAFSCSKMSIRGCSSLVLIMSTHQSASCRSNTCSARSRLPGMISTHTVPGVELMMQSSTARQWGTRRSRGMRMNCVLCQYRQISHSSTTEKQG